MELYRVTRTEDPAFAELWSLYESSFPREEQRPLCWQARAMQDADFVCMGLRDAQGLAGLLFIWEHPQFVYVEHIAISTSRRGQGLGHKALQLLETIRKDRPVILEIELVVDAHTARRRRFYEDCGYVGMDYPHEQLPFRVGDEPVPMQLMSSPVAVSASLVKVFQDYLVQHVMQYREMGRA